MFARLIRWAVNNQLAVVIIVVLMASMGIYAFLSINVEAYPDPAPAIVEVIAQLPGAAAEEVERQGTIPLGVALAGMPRRDSTRSKTLFALSHLRNQLHYRSTSRAARPHVPNY